MKVGCRDAVDIGDPECDGDPAREGETPPAPTLQDQERERGRFLYSFSSFKKCPMMSSLISMF